MKIDIIKSLKLGIECLNLKHEEIGVYKSEYGYDYILKIKATIKFKGMFFEEEFKITRDEKQNYDEALYTKSNILVENLLNRIERHCK